MPRENLQVRSGNHVKIVFDGQQVGLIQNLRCNDDYGLEPASGIGSINPVEHVPTTARYSLSCETIMLRRDLLVAKGFIPQNGDDAIKGLVFDVEVYDKRDGELLVKYIGCSYGSGDMSVTAHRVLSRNCSLMALNKTGKA